MCLRGDNASQGSTKAFSEEPSNYKWGGGGIITKEVVSDQHGMDTTSEWTDFEANNNFGVLSAGAAEMSCDCTNGNSDTMTTTNEKPAGKQN